jgi:hypothetical protein
MCVGAYITRYHHIPSRDSLLPLGNSIVRGRSLAVGPLPAPTLKGEDTAGNILHVRSGLCNLEITMGKPLVCQRCGKTRETDVWLLCGACANENAAYIAKERARGREMRLYTNRLMCREVGSRISKSRKKADAARPAVVSNYDESPHHTEQNARTDYHGDNYLDE